MVSRTTFLACFVATLGVGCLATGAGYPFDVDDSEPEPEASACFPLEDRLYRLTLKACEEQLKWSIPAACVGSDPPISQCAPLERLIAAQGDERYFCCCDPARSDTCDFNAP